MKRILSVDLGWRNLAYIVMDMDKSSVNIIEWKNVAIVEEDGLNINDSTLEELIAKTSMPLHRLTQKWVNFNPDVVYLESQPLGQMARNVKTKTLSHVFQALLVAQNFNVKFVSPKKKLMGMLEGGSYSENKKHAVKASIGLLQELGLKENADWLETLKEKKDDLADAFLQGYFSAKEPEKKSKKQSLRKKAKIDHHQIALSSCSSELRDIEVIEVNIASNFHVEDHELKNK